MKRSDLIKLAPYLCDVSQIAGIKDYCFNSGPEKGIQALEIKNGKSLALTVVPDRGLDIPYLSYKGYNISFISKTGLRPSAFFSENGSSGFLRQFNGGFLTTCGLSHAGPATEYHGLHGVISNTPAHLVQFYEDDSADEILLCVRGQIKEAEVFREHIVNRRQITVRTETDQLIIEDIIENRGFTDTPVKVLYHFNFGYPMLSEVCRLYFNSNNIVPRDEIAKAGIENYNMIDKPTIGYSEQCFFHTNSPENAYAMIHNPVIGLAVVINYKSSQCPLLCEWKSMVAGDYALGLEPASPGIFTEPEKTRVLSGGESIKYRFVIDFISDESVINHYIRI